MWNKVIHNGIRWAVMSAACFVYAMGISLFLDPNSLAPGGVSGIAIILSHIVPIETGTWILIINIPIVILGVWKFGIRFILSTIYCLVLSTICMNLLAAFDPVTTQPLLAAIAGSVLVSVGMGLIFKMGATTGGSDIIVKVLRLKLPHLKTGNIFLVLDAIVVTASGILFRDFNTAMYAGIAVVVTSVTLDFVLYGQDEAKLIYIISAKSEVIAKRIMAELDIGVTYLEGRGAYTEAQKQVIMCVTRKQAAPKVQEIVKQEDTNAFMIVSSASEIFGEGYKSYHKELL